MSILIALCLLGILIWLWQDTLRAREIAIRVAVNTCQQQQLQLLDSTVSLQRIRPTRCAGGHVCLQRTFVFEYTTDGEYRQRGFVVMDGPQVSTVGLESRPDQ